MKAFRALIENGYLNEARSLKEITEYASAVFGRDYISSDFGQVLKDTLIEGVIIHVPGEVAGVNII